MIFTLPPTLPFLENLAKALLAGRLIEGFPNTKDPFSLARATIYLPHRRACRNLREIFLTLAEKPMLLPRILPLGEEENSDDGEERPEAMDATSRQILLATLILQWHKNLHHDENAPLNVAASPFEALALAQKLAALLDQMETEQVPWENLKHIQLKTEHDPYWEITLTFLQIVTQAYPQILSEKKLISAAKKRDDALKATAKTYQDMPRPVIVAGSTGSIKATRDFMATLAKLPQSAIVLPGFDAAMDEESYAHLTHAHPQYGLKRLLEALETSRHVPSLTPCCNAERMTLLREMLRPVETTPLWAGLDRAFIPKALEGLTLIEAKDEMSEILSVSCAIVAMLQEEAATVAIVTPDRAKGLRLVAELARFGVEVDDSGGLPLLETPEGVYFNLTLALYTQPFDAALYASHLANPLNPHPLSREDYALQDKALRGFLPQPPVSLQWPNETLSLKMWLQKITPLFAHLPPISNALASLDTPEAEGFSLATPALLSCLSSLLSRQIIRTPASPKARVRLLGLPEARLHTQTHSVLCGLSEGTWPLTPQSDPWLNRTMRDAMQLDPPERRIGLAAHDFYLLLGSKNVLMSYAQKQGTTPALPSRFLQRLKVLLFPQDYIALKAKGEIFLDQAYRLERQAQPIRLTRPEPRPPVALRPQSLSVSEIATLVRDPYAIYVAHILKLTPLETYNQPVSARERGTLIHRALQIFTQKGGELRAIGQQVFAPFWHFNDVRYFWWPRFERLANAFLTFHHGRDYAALHAEVSGDYRFNTPQGITFTLKARADRIEQLRDGTTAILDYKTGELPSVKMMDANFSPQLYLEAMMLEAGAFPALNAKVSQLLYVKLTGRKENIEEKEIDPAGLTVAKANFHALIDEFLRETTPYLPRRAMKLNRDISPFDQLSRFAEWGEGEEE